MHIDDSIATRRIPTVKANQALRVAPPLLYTLMMFVLFRTALMLPAANPGTDFTPIWNAARKYLAGEPVFNSDYTIDMPHYLYSPAGTVLISPVGLFPNEAMARAVMAYLGAACVIGAIAIATRMVAPRWFHVIFPVAVSFFFITPEPVRTTLVLTNINGFLLLLLVLFVWFSLRLREQHVGWLGHFNRPEAWIAGVIAGVAVSIKPQFGVLFIVSLAYAQVAVVVIAALVAAATFIFGWFTIAEPELFFTNLVPYLSEPRPRFNGSIAGLGIVLEWPDAVVTVLTVLMVAGTLAAIAALWRWKDIDPVMFCFTAVAVCFAGGFMASGLMQFYYAIWFIPFVLTVCRRHSPMHWPVTIVVLLFTFANPVWPATGVEAFDEQPGHMPSYMFMALPFVVAVWGLAVRSSAPGTRKRPAHSR
ncbi:glycosyltransferase family 87 protein [Corynebacterium urinipleomorphum]|uniref:glycosyltransferase family 87 protein n=1 Tax=Corynebacterium urinipleomorphum TaxID=1852380 RepID=UPI000B3509E6|nr:glycosyltransferase family 87 protein [Corynebacterium urinipleomorphum]